MVTQRLTLTWDHQANVRNLANQDIRIYVLWCQKRSIPDLWQYSEISLKELTMRKVITNNICVILHFQFLDLTANVKARQEWSRYKNSCHELISSTCIWECGNLISYVLEKCFIINLTYLKRNMVLHKHNQAIVIFASSEKK